MITNLLENNNLTLIGKVTSEKRYGYEIYGEKFYIFDLEVSRLSSIVDIIPVMISERLLTRIDLHIGDNVRIKGQLRTHNNYQEDKRKLIMMVFAKEIMKDYSEEKEERQQLEADNDNEREKTVNEVVLHGHICKKPIYRKTPLNREITDLLVAVNRSYNKSDYIPCIAWGRNAKFCQDLEIETAIKIVGRIQSREYEKKFENGTSEKRVAYEVSISSIEKEEK